MSIKDIGQYSVTNDSVWTLFSFQRELLVECVEQFCEDDVMKILGVVKRHCCECERELHDFSLQIKWCVFKIFAKIFDLFSVWRSCVTQLCYLVSTCKGHVQSLWEIKIHHQFKNSTPARGGYLYDVWNSINIC